MKGGKELGRRCWSNISVNFYHQIGRPQFRIHRSVRRNCDGSGGAGRGGRRRRGIFACLSLKNPRLSLGRFQNEESPRKGAERPESERGGRDLLEERGCRAKWDQDGNEGKTRLHRRASTRSQNPKNKGNLSSVQERWLEEKTPTAEEREYPIPKCVTFGRKRKKGVTWWGRSAREEGGSEEKRQ